MSRTKEVDYYCTDGQKITIDFLFDKEAQNNKELASALNQICAITIPNRGYTGARRIVLAATSFLKYIDSVNKQTASTQKITSYNHLTPQVFRGWYMALIRRDSGNLAWRYFCALRSGISGFHEVSSEYSRPAMPRLIKPKNLPTEALDDECVETLIKALRSEVDNIYQKIELRKKVSSFGKLIKYNGSLFTVEGKYSELNIAAWWHTDKRKASDKARQVKTWIRNHKLPIDPDSFIEEINNGKWDKDYKKGIPCSKLTFSEIEISLEDFIATLNHYGYPLEIDFEDALNIKMNQNHTLHKKHNKSKLDILRLKSHGKNYPSIPQILDMYYSTAMDQATLLIFIMLQTGWNKETVLAINKDNFEHYLGESLSSNTTLIHSYKRRGQIDSSKPFETEKTITAPSDRNDKYSAYNLIKLAIKLSECLYGRDTDLESQKTPKGHIFMIINPMTKWNTSGRVGSLHSNKSQIRGIKEFLGKWKLHSHGTRLTTRNDILKKLRPTWLLLKKEQGHSSDSLNLIMGHKKRETTDIFYDSSCTATLKRRKDLGSELNKIFNLLKTFGFKGKLQPNKNIKALNKKNNSIIFSDPIRDNAIIFCSDSLNPDWNDHEKFIPKGGECRYINKCLFCSQCTITKDSLPYLIDREIFIDSQERSLSPIEYSSLYGDEHKIITYIIESWPDQDEIYDAEEYQEKHSPLLPADLKLLIPTIVSVN